MISDFLGAHQVFDKMFVKILVIIVLENHGLKTLATQRLDAHEAVGLNQPNHMSRSPPNLYGSVIVQPPNHHMVGLGIHRTTMWDEFEWQVVDRTTKQSKMSKSDLEMHSEGQGLPLTKLTNTIQGIYKFVMEIPNTMISDEFKQSAGYNYYKAKKLKIEKDVEDTYAEWGQKLKGPVVEDHVVQSLLDLHKGHKASRFESMKQIKKAVLGEGSSVVHNKYYEFENNSTTDSNATREDDGKCIREDLFKYYIKNEILQEAFEPSNDNTNVVNALQEPFVVEQDPDKNSLQSPSQINHHCCYRCGDPLEDIFCHQCTCELCGKGAHYGYNCPPKVLIVPNPEPFNNQTIDELPQTVPSFDPTCYSGDGNSFTFYSTSNLIYDSPNIFDLLPQPPLYSCEFCGNDARYGYYCTP
nr:hypothetical protein [Tanacetum cinerariifolium]